MSLIGARDAADGIDGLLDLVGELRLDLFRRRTGRRVVTTTVGNQPLESDRSPSRVNAERANHRQREGDDRGSTGRRTEIEAEPLHN
jgi:hypothetical protein